MISSSNFVPEMPHTEKKRRDLQKEKKKGYPRYLLLHIFLSAAQFTTNNVKLLNIINIDLFVFYNVKKSCVFGKFPARSVSVRQGVGALCDIPSCKPNGVVV